MYFTASSLATVDEAGNCPVCCFKDANKHRVTLVKNEFHLLESWRQMNCPHEPICYIFLDALYLAAKLTPPLFSLQLVHNSCSNTTICSSLCIFFEAIKLHHNSFIKHFLKLAILFFSYLLLFTWCL